jgi:hypothetical protein
MIMKIITADIRTLYYKLSGKAKESLVKYAVTRTAVETSLKTYLTAELGSTGNSNFNQRTATLIDAEFKTTPGPAWKPHKTKLNYYTLSNNKQAKTIAKTIKEILSILLEFENNKHTFFDMAPIVSIGHSSQEFTFGWCINTNDCYIQLPAVFKIPEHRKSEFERISDITWEIVTGTNEEINQQKKLDSLS